MELIEKLNLEFQNHRDRFKTKKILNRITRQELLNLQNSTNDCLYYKNYLHFNRFIHPEFQIFFKTLSNTERSLNFPKFKIHNLNEYGTLTHSYWSKLLNKFSINEILILIIN